MPQSKKSVNIVAINGSIRPNSYTGMALSIVVDELKKRPQLSVKIIDPKDTGLQLPGLKDGESASQKLQETVSNATGIILSTPEYHGSYSSVIKLIIDNLGFPSVLSGKPVALLGVASGQIGAIKALEHLRSVCSHVGAIVLPSPVSVANVESIFDQQGKCRDKKMETRIRSLANNLIDYIEQNICPRITLEELVREKL